jgi:putative transposase
VDEEALKKGGVLWMNRFTTTHHPRSKFVKTYEAKHPKATECLAKDRDELLAFYDFPAQHWAHVRTTNPIESTFATVRLRTKRTKGSGTRDACLAMVFKLAQVAQKGWRGLRGSELIPEVIRGVPFKDGIRPVPEVVQDVA